jgi:hypothetical protein
MIRARVAGGGWRWEFRRREHGNFDYGDNVGGDDDGRVFDALNIRRRNFTASALISRSKIGLRAMCLSNPIPSNVVFLSSLSTAHYNDEVRA